MSPLVIEAYEMAAREIQAIIRAQAPGNNIEKGLTVTYEVDGDTVAWRVNFADDVKYGIYLDEGTGPYEDEEFDPWNPNPGKGTDGIKPRHFTTIEPAVWARIEMMIEAAIQATKEKEIEEQLNSIR